MFGDTCSRRLVLANLLLSICCVLALTSVLLYLSFYNNKETNSPQSVENEAIDRFCGIDSSLPVDDEQAAGGELRWFGVIVRHGDRTPIFFLDSDPYKNFVWPEGWQMLTNPGRRRMFCLGAVLRRRYAKYLEKLPAKNVVAQSSWYRRCIETTQLVLAGLFPPQKNSGWGDDLKVAEDWQAIGVQSTEFLRSWMLCGEATCPKAEKIDRELPPKPFDEADLKFIEKVIELSNGSIRSVDDLARTKDTLLIEREYFGEDFEEPAWMSQTGEDSWWRMAKIFDQIFAKFEASREFLRLRTGVFLNYINQVAFNVTKMIETDPTNVDRMAHVFGSHDTIITWLSQAFDLYQGTASFGSGFIFEVRLPPQNRSPILRLLYSNTTNNFDIRELNLGESSIFRDSCSNSSCEVTKFFSILQDNQMLVENIEQECALEP